MVTQIKTILAGVLLALFVIAAGVIYFQHRTNTTLVQTTATDKVVIAQQNAAASEAQATIVNQAKSAGVTDAIVVRAASETQATESKIHTIRQTQEAKEREIRLAYAHLPSTQKFASANEPSAVIATPATLASAPDAKILPLVDALSRTRIDTMWQVYCVANPADTEKCPAVK